MDKYLIIKPTTACNFNCTFCSAKLLDIPLQLTFPICLKEYLLDYKPNNIIITGGEPLINTKEYFKELIEIMEFIDPNYTISLTSNMVLWYENPEKWDWLFKNPHIGIITSFQYGSDRKDTNDYSEERFIDLFNKFYERYNLKLNFIYVVNEFNRQYIEKACQLAKKLGCKLKLNQQLPLGLSTSYYPRYKLLEDHINMIKLGYSGILESLISIKTFRCPFPLYSTDCNYSRVVYVDKNNNLHVENCEDIMSSKDNIEIKKEFLFSKCAFCKMCRLCNSCSINRYYTNKEEQCQWMQNHFEDVKILYE